MKIHHVGIAVESLEAAVPIFENLLGRGPDSEGLVADQKVRVAVFAVGESRIELLEATSPDSAIARFISKRGRYPLEISRSPSHNSNNRVCA